MRAHRMFWNDLERCTCRAGDSGMRDGEKAVSGAPMVPGLTEERAGIWHVSVRDQQPQPFGEDIALLAGEVRAEVGR